MFSPIFFTGTGYNHRPHFAIFPYAPVDVNERNQHGIHKLQYGEYLWHKPNKHKYQIGDSVQIALCRNVFQKSYKDTNFITEIFEVIDTLHMNPPTYKLKDLKEGDLIQGTFYEEKLQRCKRHNPKMVESFTCICAGLSGSGKSTLVKKLILSQGKIIDTFFDYIIIVIETEASENKI